MIKVFKVILFLITLITISPIFVSVLDKFLFFWFLVTLILSFSDSKLNKSAYVAALILIATSSLMFFLDPKQTRLTHYIYKPAIWSFYFILLGSLGDFYHDYRGNAHDKKK